jgi:hypothetical protein
LGAATFTEYEYADGVLVNSVERREPEFSAEDVELLLEWQRATHEVGPHGQPMSEATSSLGDRLNRNGRVVLHRGGGY